MFANVIIRAYEKNIVNFNNADAHTGESSASKSIQWNNKQD